MADIGRATIARLLKECPQGARIEIGVHRGTTLGLIAAHDRETIGVDSFAGMPEPGTYDIVNGVSQYPKGRLSSDMRFVQRRVPKATLIKGFVPAVLGQVPDLKFAFAHIDIDHYEPTAAALEWIWPRMMKGGVICCDDWFQGRDFLAAKAIAERGAITPLSGEEGRKAWWFA